ncbi:MAG: sulfotransferase [Nitrospirales bacterium]
MHPFPLLIGGCPRSGTTALLQVLNSNPSCYISSEENIPKVLGTLSKVLGTQEHRNEVISHKGMRVLSLRESLNEKNINRHNFSQVSMWPTLRFIYQSHHEQLSPGVPLVLWGDKFPNYYKNIDVVMAVSGIKYLHITRNPLDVVNSIMRRCEMTRQGKDWWKAMTVFEEMISAWSDAYQTIQQIEGRPEVFHLHYEELVFDFHGSVARINGFLGADLAYENMLVSDPTKHYDRSFLSKEITSQILSHAVVRTYMENIKNNPFVSSAFENRELL